MAKTLLKSKNRRESTGFVKLIYPVMDSPNYQKLSGSALRLLLELIRQHRPYNNGRLVASWRFMQKRGWRSRDSLYHAIQELLHLGLIIKTTQGGKNRVSRFALTWTTVDVSDDESYRRLYVETRTIPNLYKVEKEPYTRPKAQPRKVKRAKLIAISGDLKD